MPANRKCPNCKGSGRDYVLQTLGGDSTCPLCNGTGAIIDSAPESLAAPTGSASNPCPKCGKPMAEQPRFKGLWMCPDYINALNPDHGPPFDYRCDGMELTDDGAEELEALLTQKWIERAAENN